LNGLSTHGHGMIAPAPAPIPIPIPILDTVAPLAETSDAWICDIWGVMHNGAAAFAPAAAATRRFRAGGGTVLLLSNAPRPAGAVQAQLDHLGVPRDAYDAIVSSGDLTRHLVRERIEKRVHHLGPAKDKPIFDGLGARLATIDEADYVVCSGLLDDERETPDDYRGRLAALAARNVEMICANPDLTVEKGSSLLYCAGALAALYEQLGGRVIYAGKPHLPAYDLAFETIARLRGGPVAKTRVLAIGDGLRTDIRGAHAAGIRSLFIASAVHVKAPLSPAVLAELFSGADPRPVAAMAALAWP
jgi:HAD superfamily hydrolase (TIGR01459 family)